MPREKRATENKNKKTKHNRYRSPIRLGYRSKSSPLGAIVFEGKRHLIGIAFYVCTTTRDDSRPAQRSSQRFNLPSRKGEVALCVCFAVEMEWRGIKRLPWPSETSRATHHVALETRSWVSIIRWAIIFIVIAIRTEDQSRLKRTLKPSKRRREEKKTERKSQQGKLKWNERKKKSFAK